MQARTKIVATIGPACWDEATLSQLLAAGVSVIRFNFSHAEHRMAAEKMALVRRIAATTPYSNVAILADLQGPRIRVGELPPDGLVLEAGNNLTLAAGVEGSDEDIISVDYAGLAADVLPGNALLLDDGQIALEVISSDVPMGRIECTVVTGGRLYSHKGINVPGRALSVPAITEKDRVDLSFALANGADMVALSFVRSAQDVRDAKMLIASHVERQVPVIAKIEKRAAVENFAEILAEADGIMVARGDLGVEMPAEVLPGIQKQLIAEANKAGKPVITATQMLDSMIRNPRPTRAEATDVANAVLDGTDAIMLSGETAAGKYSVEAVKTMARIAIEAEKLFDYEGWSERIGRVVPAGEGSAAEDRVATGGHAPVADSRLIAEVICGAADWASDALSAHAIIAITRSGSSARLVAKHRPRSTLIAVTDNLQSQRSLAVSWGVRALLLGDFGDTQTTLAAAEQLATHSGLIKQGDLLVFIGDLPEPLPGQTTMLKVQVAGTPYDSHLP